MAEEDIKLTEEGRQVAVDWAMKTVIDEVKKRRLVPMVMLAYTADGTPAIVPCNPSMTLDLCIKFIQQAAAASLRGKWKDATNT